MRRHKGSEERDLTSGLGAIRLRRTYFHCSQCEEGEYAADRYLGVMGSLTAVARELVCLASIGCGFATAARRLMKFCGWTFSKQTMRRTSFAEGSRIEQWRAGGSATPGAVAPSPTTTAADVAEPEALRSLETLATGEGSGASAASVTIVVSPAAPVDTAMAVAPVTLPTPAAAGAFRRAKGEVEFLTDGTSVNTTAGWRELRIALWLKRALAEPVPPHLWGERTLPKPAARSVLIDLAESEPFAARWRPWTTALGIVATRSIHVLADGAEWIWKQVGIQFPGASGTLDNYHAIERLAESAKNLYGSGTGTALGWTSVATSWLIAKGWPGVCAWIAAVRAECADRGSEALAVSETEAVANYFAKHFDHLNYAQRLAEGRSIGSGPVEGAAKQLVGRRLKQTGARWRERNAIAMATLCSCEYAEDWDDYWQPSYPATAA